MVSVSAECRLLYRPRYLPIVSRYVDFDSADISVDTSVDMLTDISQSLYRLRVGRVSVDMSTDVSVEGCTKKNMIHERIRTAHLFIKSEELNSQFYENNFESL